MRRQTSQKAEPFACAPMKLILGVFAIFLCALIFISVVTPVSAATNSTLNFQARLESNTGAIAPDGTYNIQFKLYNVSSGGSALWTETYQNSAAQGVTVTNGYVSVNLGSLTAFPTTINWDQNLYLTMNIGGTSAGASPTYDGEMTPRLQLTSVPYAFRAGSLATYNGATTFTSTLSILAPTGGNQTFQIPDQAAAGTYSLLTTNTANNSFIQLQATTPGTAQTGNFNITGTGIAGILQATTSVKTPLIDTAAAGTLSIGTTTATAITIGNATSNILTTVNGTMLVKPTPSHDSTTAFQIQNAAGAALLTADTTTRKVTVTSGATTALYAAPVIDTDNTIADFPTASWTSTGWTTGAGFATHTSGNTNALTTTWTPSIGTTYEIAYAYSNCSAVNTLGVTVGGITLEPTTSCPVGLTRNFFTATATTALKFTPNSTYTGTVQSVYIRALTTAVTPALAVANSSAVTTLEVRAGGSVTNAFIGVSSGQYIDSGTNLTAVGSYALQDDSIGHDNAAVGTYALQINTSGAYNAALGAYSLQSNTSGNYNTATGYYALQANTNGANNAAVGYNALKSSTTASFNAGFGSSALQSTTTGGSNVAVGYSALQGNTTGNDNVALGANALYSNTSGPFNVAVGSSALRSNTTGNYNAAVGYQSLYTNSSGTNNSALGYYTLYNNTTGSNNSAIGTQALRNNTSGGNNNAMGNGALNGNTSGNNNTAIGYQSLYSSNTGSDNIAIGDVSLNGYTGASNNNVGIGYAALASPSLGSYNTAIGSSAGYCESNGHFCTNNAIQNAAAIGAYTQVQASNSIVLGSVDNPTKIGIGITVPSNTFSVSPLDYQTGTATRTNSSATLVGTGTTWTAAMVGDIIVFADGTTNTVSAFTDATHITMGTTFAGTTDASPGYYRFHKVGLQVTTAGFVGLGTASPAYALDVSGNINSTTGYRYNGTAGATTTCSAGNVLQATVVQGGIITGATCSASSGLYIQNQSSAQQSGTFWISGTGRLDTSVQTPAIDTAAAGTLSVGTSNATTINVGTNALAHTIALGTSSSAAQSVSVGSTNAGSTVGLTGGAAALSIANAGLSITGNTTTNGTISTTVGGAAGVGTQQFASNLYIQARGENLVTNGTGLLGNNYNFSSFTFDPVNVYAGGGSFKNSTFNAVTFNDELIPVDPTSTYILNLSAESTVFVAGAHAYFGVAPYDIDGTQINPWQYSKYPGSTDTTLAAQLNPGDTTVTLTNATGWSTGVNGYSRNFAWYGYTNSKGYTYPDYTYTHYGSYNYSDFASNGAWATSGISGNVITLRAPWSGPTIPSGASIRNNTSGGTYKYISAVNVAVPSTWTQYSGRIGGFDTTGSQATNLFPYGTAYVKTMFLMNRDVAGNTTNISDISFTASSGVFQAQVPGITPLIIQGATSQTSDLMQILNASGSIVSKFDSAGNLVVVAAGTSTFAGSLQVTGAVQGGSFDAASTVALNIGSSNATSIALGKTTSNIQTTVNGFLVVKPTTGNDSATALLVQNAAGTPLLTADTINSQVIVRSGSSDAVLGAALVDTAGGTNDFPTGWTATNWTTAANSATHTSGNTSVLSSTWTPTNGTTYQVSYNYTLCSATNTLGITMGGVTLETPTSCSGSNTKVITATSTAPLTFTPASTYVGVISNVLIKALTTSVNPALVVKNSSNTATLEVRSSGSTSNIFIGINAGKYNTSSGTQNVALGTSALQSNTSGTNNVAIGLVALAANTTGTNNAAVGPGSLQNNTIGNSNVAVGMQSLYSNTTGSNNDAVGVQSLTNNTTGYDNVAFGHASLYSNTTGFANTGTGYASLYTNTTGTSNTANGFYTLYNNTTGGSDTASGYNALANNTTGSSNTAYGVQGLYNNTTGSSNSSLGYYSLYNNTTGSGNTGLGYSAGYQDTGTFFATSAALQNATAIGAFAQVQASNSIVLGSVDTPAKIGIGITVPSNTFSVSPLDYQTGTATRTNSSATLVGTGTTWTAAMVGDIIVFADGTTNTVSAFTDATHITMGTTFAGTTDASPVHYRFHKVGLQVTSAGLVGIANAAPAYALDVSGTINSTTGYRYNGTAGSTTTCSGGNVLQNTVVQGGIITGGTCVAGGTGLYVSLQATTPGTADTGNFNISGTGIASILQAASFDRASGGILSIGATNATSITLGQSTTLASGKTLLVQGAATFKNATNSTNAFEVQNSGGGDVLNVDTTDGYVGIGTVTPAAQLHIRSTTTAAYEFIDGVSDGDNYSTLELRNNAGDSKWQFSNKAVTGRVKSYEINHYNGTSWITPFAITDVGYVGINTTGPSYPLDVNGSINTNTSYKISGTDICTSSGCTASATSAIQNQIATQQASSNFWINGTGRADTSIKTPQLDTATGVTLAIGNTNATAITLGNASSNILTTINGTLLVKPTPSHDSTTEFQIQNAASTALFTADTSAMQIVVGSTTNGIILSSTGVQLKGTARNAKTIVLTAEYAGAVLDAGTGSNNTGTMTSGIDLANRMNYYKWTTSQATNQSYDVDIQVPIPSDFDSWNSNPLAVNGYTSNLANGTITLETRDSSGTVICNFVAVTPGSTSTWASNNSACLLSTGTYTAGGYMTLRLRLQSPTSGDVRVGNIVLSYLSKY